MTASATLDGTFRLQPSRSTVLSGSSSGGGGDGLPRAPGSSSEDGPHPPKAILLKLTAAAYEQIRALNAAPAGSCSGQLRLEVPAAAGYNNSSGGGDRPMSLRIGSHSFSLAPRPATAGLKTDLLRRVTPTPAPRAGSSSQRAADTAAPALQYVAQALQHQYITSLASTAEASSSSSTRKVGASKGAAPTAAAAKRAPAVAAAAAPGADVTAAQEKTAANMGERIRERAAQLEKQKEKRKVVVLDDAAGVLRPGAGGGKKGARVGKKGASASSTGPIGAKASPLLRASAASSQRHASPAGSSPRASPLLGASSGPAPRPASRLVASEAAKGLMSRMEKERTEQQAKIDAEKERNKQAILSEQAEVAATAQQQATTAPASLPYAKREAGTGQTGAAGKVRMASSTSSTSSYSSASASTQASASTSATSASVHRLLDTQAEEASSDVSAAQKLKQSPPKPRIDDDDLASASSSDDEMEDVMPLARRVSPTKSDAVAVPSAAPEPASTVNSGSKSKDVGVDSAAAPAVVRPQMPPTISSTASSSRASSVSSDERSASSTSEMSIAKRKYEAVRTTAHATGSNDSLQVPQPATKKAKTRKAATPEPEISASKTTGVETRVQASPPRGGPRTQGRTSGGTRLSKPLPKRAPGSKAGSKSASPAPSATSLSPAPSAASASPPTNKESGPGISDVSPASAASPPTRPATANGATAPSPPDKLSLTLSVPTVARSPADMTETKLASPLRSPGLSHPSLPAKPTVSPIAANRSPLLLATKISPGPRPTYDGTDTGQSAPPSPVPSSRPVIAAPTSARDTLAVNARQSPAPPAPAPLPVKPSTVIPPFGQSTARPSEGSLKRSASNASLRSKIVDGVATSAPASRASSPIVSTIAASQSSGFAQGGMPNGKSNATRPDQLQDRRTGPGDVESSAKRLKKATGSKKTEGSRADIVWTSSEGEEGEAEESNPERPRDARQVAAAAAVRTRAGSSSRPRTTSDDSSASTSRNDAKKNKDGLPSFSKKSGVAGAKAKKTGRASELLREGTVSRATTPNSSDAPARSPGAQPGQGSPPRAAVVIASDTDFHRYSQKFSDELFPAYLRLRRRLDVFEASIANGTADGSAPRISTRELQILVDETNERGQELERIKDAMTKYSREREKAAAAEASVSRSVSAR